MVANLICVLVVGESGNPQQGLFMAENISQEWDRLDGEGFVR